MIKYTVRKKGIVTNSWTSDFANASYYEECFGLPERWVPHKDEGGSYDEADVLEERVVEMSSAVDAVMNDAGEIVQEAIPAVMKKEVKLKAEYTVEIEDISAQVALQNCMAARKAEYPTPEEFLNAFFDGGDEAVAALQAKRLAIKQKYPKPQEGYG